MSKRQFVATLITPAMREAPGGRRQIALAALGLQASHGTVLAELRGGATRPAAPAKVTAHRHGAATRCSCGTLCAASSCDPSTGLCPPCAAAGGAP